MTNPTGIIKKGRLPKKSKGGVTIPKNEWTDIVQNNLGFTNKPRRRSIFASNSSLCSRQTAGMILLPKDFKVENGPASQFYFKIGSSFEMVVKQAMTKGGKVFLDEMRIEEELDDEVQPISGRIDFVVEEDEDLVLVELKSCGKLPTKPKPSHKAQLMTYLLLTGAPKGILWYISRNVADFKGTIQQTTFEIIPTEEELYQTAREIAIGGLGATKKLIPNIPSHMKKSYCGFCPLYDYCWNGEPIAFQGKAPSVNEQDDLEIHANDIAEEFLLLRSDNYLTLRDNFNEELGILW